MTEALLRCEGLVRRFGERIAVDDVSFEIGCGETYGLLGPNGSGKTTTISLLAGILSADAGSVMLAGEPITTSSTNAKAAIGLVPQEIALYQDLTSTENLRFFGRLQGLEGKALKNRIDAVLEIVGLRDRASDRLQELSGGMKRRVNIAAGLLHEPKLLVLDEPTVGVDPQSRNQILASVEALGGEGLSVLYTTHYMEEAERLCDRVGVLDHGVMIAEGTKDELIAHVGEQDLIIVSGEYDDALVSSCGALTGVDRAEMTGRGLEVLTADGTAVLSPLVALFGEHGAEIGGLQLREPNLEAVFLKLTGRALRD